MIKFRQYVHRSVRVIGVGIGVLLYFFFFLWRDLVVSYLSEYGEASKERLDVEEKQKIMIVRRELGI